MENFIFCAVPEKLEIGSNSSIANKHGIKISGVHTLVPNLYYKSKYILHYRSFQMYSFLGIKLVSVHRILKFKHLD